MGRRTAPRWSTLVAVVLASGLVGAGFALSRESTRDDAARHAELERRALDQPSKRSLADERVSAAGAPLLGSRTEERAADVVASARTSGSSASDAAVVVELQDADTHEPEPNATVVCTTSVDPHGGFESGAEPRVRSTTATADEHGRVVVALDGDRVRVQASVGSRFGAAEILRSNATSTPIVVPLWDDFDAVVAVVDLDGRPVADAPVVLRRRDESDDWRPIAATTTYDGVALLHHAGQRMRETRARREAARRPAPSFEVALECCTAVAVAASIDERRATTAPLTLTMPDCGTLYVDAVDGDGAPVQLTGAGCVSTNASSRSERRRLEAWFADPRAADLPSGAARGRSLDGRIRFDHVQLGLDVAVSIAPFEGARVARWSGAGPRRKGERVDVHLTVERRPTASR